MTVKKVIHFLTHKERPDFDGPKSKIAWNCPKIIFAFDQKIPNSKTKLQNDPLKSKNTFWPTRSVRIEIFILRNYLRNCPRIIFAFDHDFQNSKIKLKNYPLKSKKPKISLKSQNWRKLTHPKYAHNDYKTRPSF